MTAFSTPAGPLYDGAEEFVGLLTQLAKQEAALFSRPGTGNKHWYGAP
jgi:hypothetical protein